LAMPKLSSSTGTALSRLDTPSGSLAPIPSVPLYRKGYDGLAA
jgi:hypothetical protein